MKISGIVIAVTATLAAEAPPSNPPDLNCGAYCLYTSLRALGNERMTYDEVHAALGPATSNGYSIAQLSKVAEAAGFQTLGVRTNLSALQQRKAPFACIALVRDTHFVNLAEVHDGVVQVIDPPNAYALPVSSMTAIWDGTALLIAPEALESEEALGQAGGKSWLAGAVLVSCAAGAGAWFFGRSRRERLR